MEEIANEIRRGIAAIAEKFQELSDHEKYDFEKRIVFELAKEKSLWISDLYSLGKPTQAEGYENTLAIEEAKYVNNDYVIHDLYPRNVLKDVNNTIYVVDDIVRLNKLDGSFA